MNGDTPAVTPAPTPETGNASGAAPAAPKATRGPTRASVRFADLLEDIAKNSDARKTLIGDLGAGVTAKALRAEVKDRRSALKKSVEASEAAIAYIEDRAALLERTESLSDDLRRALVAMYAHEYAHETVKT